MRRLIYTSMEVGRTPLSLEQSPAQYTLLTPPLL